MTYRMMTSIVLMLAGSTISYAQDATVKELKEASTRKIEKDPKDTTVSLWKKGGIFTLNLSQGSLSNWQGGGDKSSFSAVGFLNAFAYYKEGKNSWDNSIDLGYGYINTTSLGTRKSDDRIDLISRYGYEFQPKWSVGALFNFRSQFTSGFNYEQTQTGAFQKTKISNFLAPAYVLLSLGANYKPTSYFSVFISPLTQRWTLVQDDYLSNLGAYGVAPGSHSRSELGAFLSADFNHEVAKNVVFKSRLDLFSNYKANPENVDLYWTNVLALKVNRFLSTNIAVDLLYDDDAIKRLQVRQLLGVGFSAKF